MADGYVKSWRMGCVTCQKSKASLTCGLCGAEVCKSCVHFVEDGAFSFLAEVPPALSHSAYCGSCFSVHVAEPMAVYEADVERAKDINVFMKNQGKETRLIKRTEKPVRVADCPDHDEALLRLAFFAAQKGYNSIVDVDLKPEKVRLGAYQTTVWSGTGIPAHVESHRLVRDRSIWQNPN